MVAGGVLGVERAGLVGVVLLEVAGKYGAVGPRIGVPLAALGLPREAPARAAEAAVDPEVPADHEGRIAVLGPSVRTVGPIGDPDLRHVVAVVLSRLALSMEGQGFLQCTHRFLPAAGRVERWIADRSRVRRR